MKEFLFKVLAVIGGIVVLRYVATALFMLLYAIGYGLFG